MISSSFKRIHALNILPSTLSDSLPSGRLASPYIPSGRITIVQKHLSSKATIIINIHKICHNLTGLPHRREHSKIQTEGLRVPSVWILVKIATLYLCADILDCLKLPIPAKFQFRPLFPRFPAGNNDTTVQKFNINTIFYYILPTSSIYL